jgi:hypothetical protein
MARAACLMQQPGLLQRCLLWVAMTSCQLGPSAAACSDVWQKAGAPPCLQDPWCLAAGQRMWAGSSSSSSLTLRSNHQCSNAGAMQQQSSYEAATNAMLLHRECHQTSSAPVCLAWARRSGAHHPATLLLCCWLLTLHLLVRQGPPFTDLTCCQSRPLTGGQQVQRQLQHS